MSHRRPDLHVICLDDPTFPVYGGVIDMHYRIQALSHAGVRMYIHAFYKGATPDGSVLKQWAEDVFFYPRLPPWQALQGAYMMTSRMSTSLLQRLLQDDVPVLFEGMHTSGMLAALKHQNPQRKLFLRSHNIESHYYHDLFMSSTSWWKRLYYQREFRLLRKQEAEILPLFTHIWSISAQEVNILKAFNEQTSWLPACIQFHSQQFKYLPSISANECTLLFHGNFGVSENRHAGQWLIDYIIKTNDKSLKLILAGKALDTCHFLAHPQIQYVSDPEFMDAVLAQADLVVLPGKQASGVKIKLLESLSAGKRVLCSAETASGSGLEDALPIFRNVEDLNRLIAASRSGGMDGQYLQVLQSFQRMYNPQHQAEQILKALNA